MGDLVNISGLRERSYPIAHIYLSAMCACIASRSCIRLQIGQYPEKHEMQGMIELAMMSSWSGIACTDGPLTEHGLRVDAEVDGCGSGVT